MNRAAFHYSLFSTHYFLPYGRLTKTTMEYQTAGSTPTDKARATADACPVRALRKTETFPSPLRTVRSLTTLPVKKRADPRHLQREQLVRGLFAYSFSKKQSNRDERVVSIWKSRRVIDRRIQNAAPAWPLSKINRIDAAVLRLAVWELFVKKETPPKVVVDEAVELAKSLGSEGSAGFVNGVLGTILSKIKEGRT